MMKSYCFIFYVLLLLYSILASAATEVTVIDNNSENIKPAIQQEEDRMPLISGSHLLVMISWFSGSTMVLKRDENGRVVKVGGICGLTLEYLANSLHFTFEYVYESDFPNILDDQGPQKPGRISKFINSDSAIMLGTFGYTQKRNKIIDYTLPTSFSSMALLIPKPTMQKKNYALAVIEPFQSQVWFFVGISLIVGVTSLYWIWRGISYIKRRLDTINKDTDNIISETTRFQRALDFTFGLIVIQGSFASGALGSDRKILVIRFLTGAWCLTCFVLVTAYSSVLVSFMTAPEIYKPIINSVNDLPNKPDIHVTVTKGWLADALFESAVGNDKPNGIFKFIGEELKRHPEQRCTSTDHCLDRVRTGSSVYIYPENFILNMIGNDWKKNGQCDFTIAKERFMMALGTGILLKKNSPYTEQFSREIARMQAAGLLNLWLNDNAIDPTTCLKKINQEMDPKKTDDLKPLTLKGLSGAFIILGVGYAMAIAAFIVESVHGLIINSFINRTAVVKLQPAVVGSYSATPPTKRVDQHLQNADADDEGPITGMTVIVMAVDIEIH